MRNPALTILAHTRAIMAPVTAMLDRAAAIAAVPTAIVNFNRRLAAMAMTIEIQKD